MESAAGEARPAALHGEGGLRLVADAWGDPSDPPVLLLHGGGQTRHSWGGTAAALAADGWYALALDLRGHGESEWAKDGDYSFDGFVADLHQVLAGLAGRPVLVGASLGGITSLLAEGESREPVAQALVLVDVVPSLDREGVGRILAFMSDRPDGFASLDEAADAIAEHLPHRPRPTDLSGLRKNLRLHGDGRYRWHWDPRFLTGERRPAATRNPDRLRAAARAPAGWGRPPPGPLSAAAPGPGWRPDAARRSGTGGPSASGSGRRRGGGGSCAGPRGPSDAGGGGGAPRWRRPPRRGWRTRRAGGS